jgi:hypothetical protein
MTRKPRVPEFAPRPAIYPLSEREMVIIDRWLAEGREACGTCQHFDIAHPINLTATAYCFRFCIWTAPWHRQPADDDKCSGFALRAPPLDDGDS